MNKLHDKHGHFKRAPLGLLGGFVWFSMIVGCLAFWLWVGKYASEKAWEFYCNTWHERMDAEENIRASTPIRYRVDPAQCPDPVPCPTIKGCFTGESLDEIARMIREGDDVGAIRKLRGNP